MTNRKKQLKLNAYFGDMEADTKNNTLQATILMMGYN